MTPERFQQCFLLVCNGRDLTLSNLEAMKFLRIVYAARNMTISSIQGVQNPSSEEDHVKRFRSDMSDLLGNVCDLFDLVQIPDGQVSPYLKGENRARLHNAVSDVLIAAGAGHLTIGLPGPTPAADVAVNMETSS